VSIPSFSGYAIMLPEQRLAERKSEHSHAYRTAFGRFIDMRIKELRAREPQYTRDLVARLTGMSRQHLWRALRGEADLTKFELAQLARTLRLEPQTVAAHYLDDGSGVVTTYQARHIAEVQTIFNQLNHPTAAVSETTEVRKPDGSTSSRYTPLSSRLPSINSQIHGAMQDDVDPLPREMKIRAMEFRLEALRAGADDAEITFIDSVLASPEAIFRQSGYSEPLNADAQRVELDSVIEMLRAWLREHMRRRGALERSAGG
jgi:AraC-like DNA-binding protein